MCNVRLDLSEGDLSERTFSGNKNKIKHWVWITNQSAISDTSEQVLQRLFFSVNCTDCGSFTWVEYLIEVSICPCYNLLFVHVELTCVWEYIYIYLNWWVRSPSDGSVSFNFGKTQRVCLYFNDVCWSVYDVNFLHSSFFPLIRNRFNRFPDVAAT